MPAGRIYHKKNILPLVPAAGFAVALRPSLLAEDVCDKRTRQETNPAAGEPELSVFLLSHLLMLLPCKSLLPPFLDRSSLFKK